AGQRRQWQHQFLAATPPAQALSERFHEKLMAQALQVDAEPSRMRQHAGRRFRLAADRALATAQDSGFLATYALPVRTEEFLVIQAYRRDDRAIGINQVHGIQAPPQAHLKYRKIQPGTLHQEESSQGAVFKI